MPRAVILGGTGAIGYAVANRLLADNWTIISTGRNRAHFPFSLAKKGVRFEVTDRGDSRSLAKVLAGGADLLVDCVCYDAVGARMLLPHLANISRTVMISSKAIYVDASGNHSNSDTPPSFAYPIDEEQPTIRPNGLDPDSRMGYGANKVAAEETLLDSGFLVTILRPSKIHGVHARRPREWVFVRRALERRSPLLVSAQRSGVDHPSAAANIAALIATVAPLSGNHILNIADPDAPSGMQIAHIVADYLGWLFDVKVVTDPQDRWLHPWDTRYAITLDTRRAEQLGYRPAGNYATTVKAELRWLKALAHNSPTVPLGDDPFFAPYFDYPGEDRLLARAHNRS